MVRYDKGLMGRCRAAGLCPVTIAIGREIVWSGGVSREVQIHLLELLTQCQAEFPPDALPEVVSRVRRQSTEPSANGTPKTVDLTTPDTIAPVADTVPVVDSHTDASGVKKAKHR